MRFKYAFCLLMLSMTTLSAERKQCAPEPQCIPEPEGVTRQPCQVITPPQAPEVSNGTNVFFTADFIYWRAGADNFQYAASGIAIVGNDGVTPVPPPKRGETKSPGFDFEPGFKVGAGVRFAHDGFDLYANYTWLNPAKVASTQKRPTGDMVGPADPYYGAPTLSKVQDHFKQSFNVLDLELGRNFFLSKFLTLRPYFGFKFSSINQHVRNVLTVFNNDTNGLGVNSSIIIGGNTITQLLQKQSVKSWGIGLRGGITPIWYFMENFGLYGNLAISGVWTYYKNITKTSFKGFSVNPPPGNFSGVTANIGRSFHTITPVVELGLGLTYLIFFHCDARALTFSAGWEEQMWIGFNGGLPGGSMTLQGFTFKTKFEF